MNFCYTLWGLIHYWLKPEALSLQCLETLELSQTATSFEFTYYVKVFLFTCLVEAPFYFIALKSKPLKIKFWATIGCNFATHPIIYFLIPGLVTLSHGYYWQSMAIGESFAPLAELLLLWKLFHLPLKKAALWSLVANLCSWTLGTLLY